MLTPRKRIALICTVWGADFIEFFCRYTLASLLAPPNLSIRHSYELTLLLYTEREHLDLILNDPTFKTFAGAITVKPIFLDRLPTRAAGHWAAWQHAVTEFSADFFAFVIVIPDCIYGRDSFVKILDSLEHSSIVYYSLPQVCRELIVPALEQELGKNSGRCIDLTSTEIVDLFLKYVNPKHAAVLARPSCIVSHPEYIIDARRGEFSLTEFACQPLAMRSAASRSVQLSALSADEKIDFLEILGISCDGSLKYLDWFYRRPALGLNYSRQMNLASWLYTFRDPGSAAYSRTATRVRIRGSKVVEQGRIASNSRRVRYMTALADFNSASYRLYVMSTGYDVVQSCISLAMCLPNIRRKLKPPVTIFLPISGNASEAIEAIERTNSRELFAKFALMHVVPGRLLLKNRDTFKLRVFPGQATGICHVVNPALDQGGKVTGQLLSNGEYVDENVVAYMISVDYGDPQELLAGLERGSL